jgi:GrpB-like predicted nucleotidyltransferase (UPF0157 family)
MPEPGAPAPLVLQPYEVRPAHHVEQDARVADVARAVAELVRANAPELVVEHVGSTAVPGLPGKDVVDLAVTYPAGGLERARAALDALGFQRQQGAHAFPEERPMRTGAVDVGGRRWRLHAHVLRQG